MNNNTNDKSMIIWFTLISFVGILVTFFFYIVQ